MGQAQRKRQQGVRYQEVELELWELDADEEQESYGNRNRRNNSRSRSGYAGSRGRAESGRGNRNYVGRTSRSLQTYERRREQSSGQTRQTRQRSPQRELQVQDIRRYQGTRAEDRINTRSAYRGSARPVQSIKRRRARRTSSERCRY